MTITLTPDIEAEVRAFAEMHSVGREEAFSTLLNQALAKAEEESRRTLAAPHAGVTDEHTSS